MNDYRVAETPAAYQKPTSTKVTEPRTVADLCRAMTRYRQEVFRVLVLNSKNRLVRKVTVAKGTLNATLVHPRDVFYPAIKANAAAIILVHNHPSGDPTISEEDRRLTRRIREAGSILGIELMDHIIVAKGGYTSFREHEELP